MADTTGNYALDLPDTNQVKNLLRDSLELYERRNALIMRSRRSLLGQNPIKAPTLTQYKIQPQHTYFLLAAVNEKVSRFEDLPEIKVTPVGISSQARSRSTMLEHATNRMHELTEEQSGGMVWSRQIFDAILTDGGVARIERAPAANWPEITMLVDKDGNPWD